MTRKLKMSVASMVESAKAAIEEITVEEAMASQNEDGVLIVDIRDIRERQREGFIPGSLALTHGKMPVGQLKRTTRENSFNFPAEKNLDGLTTCQRKCRTPPSRFLSMKLIANC